MQPLWRTRRKFLKKRKTATIWPSNPTPGHISRKDKDSKLKRYMHLNVHTSTIYQSQDVEETEVSIHRGMGKEDVVCIYNGIRLSHKKEWNNAICSNMNGPGDYHTKQSQSDRERQVSHDIIYLWNLTKWYKWSYLQNRNRLTDTESKFTVTKGDSWGGG